MIIFCIAAATTDGKSTKKIKDESNTLNKKLIGKVKPSPPAIIAIEIVDPNENKTSKNSKRTIDSHLGYGYQSPPRYQVYKYSQRDIPPYRGSSQFLSGNTRTNHFDIQKSVSYRVPTQNHKNLNQYYQPGTTLYSTVNSQGQVGSLSSHLPQQPYSNEPHVPVIILRVYPSQLNDPSAALHANLPQTHPLASTVNSIDIQALLAKYVQNLLVEQHHHQEQQPQYQYQYQQQPEYQYQYMQQPQYHYPVSQPGDGLLTHENYPRETHTRVVFRTDKNKVGANTDTKTIQIALPEHAYSAVQVETPHMQYSYTSPGDESSQGYYYQQGGESGQNYYQSAPGQGYQEQQQQYVQPENVQNDVAHSYHSQQKRSKQGRYTRISLQGETSNDVIRLAPIKA